MDKDHTDWETEYQDAMGDYARAKTDKERDDALMIAHWALTNLTDKIDQLRAGLAVPQ